MSTCSTLWTALHGNRWSFALQEELRALRTAIQLMVKRAEENPAQPVHQGMEPIQEGASEAGTDAHTEEDAEEGTPQQTPQNSPGGRAPYGCVQAGSSSFLPCPANPVRQSRYCA